MNKRDEYIQKHNNDHTDAMILVKGIGGSNAKIEMLQKKKDEWVSILACDGFVGKNGIGKAKEGDTKTPVGDFGIITAFGVKENPGTQLPYVDVNEDIYCAEEGPYYNKIVNIKEVGGPIVGEHLIDYQPHYHYGFFFDYNKECIVGKGSAIFFHCFGPNPYTGGCVAVSEENMIFILKNATLNTRLIVE